MHPSPSPACLASGSGGIRAARVNDRDIHNDDATQSVRFNHFQQYEMQCEQAYGNKLSICRFFP
ncbi:hypothetical protein GCM10023156_19250 [Novipirellula rosea]|uniref:Uncharacterized protein n=1 Tax=Novipirellula rosea TaxID=1031540 RepID=A0ABP8MJS6_9BACT